MEVHIGANSAIAVLYWPEHVLMGRVFRAPRESR
jgi:hypothetical protein